MATVDRTEEVQRFLTHLDAQVYRHFELIIVDQNPDNRLAPVLEPYQERFRIVHLRSERGLSLARNVGLHHVQGDVVAFPDDDCWYPPGFFENLASFLNEHPEIDGISGRALTDAGSHFVISQRFASPGFLSLKPLTRGRWPGSVGIFVRTRVVERVGKFDEKLGLGAGTLWGCGEDWDYVFRALEEGFKLYYNPDIVIFHPPSNSINHHGAFEHAYRQGAGTAHVLKSHRFPFWFFAVLQAYSLGVVIPRSLMRGRWSGTRSHWNHFRGMLRGWFSS